MSIDLNNPVVRRPKTYVNATVPFIKIGNERALSDLQLVSMPWLAEFFTGFRHCFERDDVRQIWLYRPYAKTTKREDLAHAISAFKGDIADG